MTRRTPGGRRAALGLAVLLVVGGGGAAAAGALGGGDRDQPPLVAAADARVPAAAEQARGAPSGDGGAPVAGAGASEPSVAAPSSVAIPAIGVSSSLLALGLSEDGSIAVPQPGPDYDTAAWFTGSPRPGAVGPSVIEGHVDSAEGGPSVFARLGELEVGDPITVTREDGSSVTFEVTGSQRYAKDDFPTLAVYGNTEDPQLRLITCGGSFDAAPGHYRDNTVVFARAACAARAKTVAVVSAATGWWSATGRR